MPRRTQPLLKQRSKRLNITFTPDVLAALAELSEASGIAAASFVATFMSDALPVIEAMTKAFREARTAPLRAAESMEGLTHSLMAKAAQGSLAFRADVERSERLRHTTRKRRSK